jgi:hypothetical protein
MGPTHAAGPDDWTAQLLELASISQKASVAKTYDYVTSQTR